MENALSKAAMGLSHHVQGHFGVADHLRYREGFRSLWLARPGEESHFGTTLQNSPNAR